MRFRVLPFSSVTFKTRHFFYFLLYLLITFWRYLYIIFKDKKKVIKKSQNSGRYQCFSYYFCLIIDGSGSEFVSLTNGSGWPKNMWILRVRVRIRNTANHLAAKWLGNVDSCVVTWAGAWAARCRVAPADSSPVPFSNVWIPDPRIVPLDYGSRSFLQWLSGCQQKVSFFSQVLSIITYLHLHQSSKIKKSQNCRNQG